MRRKNDSYVNLNAKMEKFDKGFPAKKKLKLPGQIF